METEVQRPIPGKMNQRFICCLQTPNCHCIYVNFEIPACWLVQLGHLSMSMNCLFLAFLFSIPSVAAQNYDIKDKEILYDLSDLGCAPPWVQIYDSCYLFSNQSGNWEKSKYFCSNRSSYLVEIGSRQEQLGLAGVSSFIHLQIRSLSYKYFHFLRLL